MVRSVLLFASLATFIFVACNGKMRAMENADWKNECVPNSILSDDCILGDTIIIPPIN